MGVFIYLTPFIPLSFKGEGEEWFLKGRSPFKLAAYYLTRILNPVFIPSSFP